MCDRVHASLLELLEDEEESTILPLPDEDEGFIDSSPLPVLPEPDQIVGAGGAGSSTLAAVPSIVDGGGGKVTGGNESSIESLNLNPDQFYDPSYLPVLNELVE